MALANATQIVDFADALTRSADSIHDRLLTAIRNNEVDHPTAQMIFQDESILRQRANGLYIDAASCVVAGLDEAQKSVIDLVDTANARMRKIKEMAQLIDLVAEPAAPRHRNLCRKATADHRCPERGEARCRSAHREGVRGRITGLPATVRRG
jgi:hypothetical protein